MPIMDSPPSRFWGAIDKLSQTWPAKMGRGILDAVQLPGQVAGGIMNTPPAQPGMWSDMDEARQQATQSTMMDRAADLGGLVMGGGYGGAPAGSVGMAGARNAPKLPMDEASRMGRAAEQGYTVDAYKGMYAYDWRTEPGRNWKGEIISQPEIPGGRKELTSIDARQVWPENKTGAGFFSNSPGVASRFAEAMNGAVYPVKLKFENPKVIDAQGAYAADFQFGSGAGRLKLGDNSPHDGVILKNTKDEGDVYIPREPSQIRSRWAAFDPANRNSGELLGAGNPLVALLMQSLQAQPTAP
jgi:hypothetical protein